MSLLFHKGVSVPEFLTAMMTSVFPKNIDHNIVSIWCAQQSQEQEVTFPSQLPQTEDRKRSPDQLQQVTWRTIFYMHPVMPQSISVQTQGFHFLHVVYQGSTQREGRVWPPLLQERSLIISVKGNWNSDQQNFVKDGRQVLLSSVLSFVIKVMQLTFAHANR